MPSPLVILAPRGAPFAAQDDQIVVSDWADFLARQTAPAGFWIAAGWEGDRRELAETVRRAPWWDRLILCAPDGDASALDAACPLEEARYRCQKADAARAALQLDPAALDPEERLLLYLYLREGTELVPQLKRESRALYHYPLMESVSGLDDGNDRLAMMVRRQLLEPVTLVDRIRRCRYCASGHLNYVDVCPACSSLQIQRSPSLHCFTCGHVARQKEFEVEGGLACPKCASRLRHIGVDYDRPMTQMACGACHHVFVDAKIVTRCLDCGKESDPENLDVAEIFTLRLSSRGRSALRAGQVHESFAALDSANYVVPAYFRQMLDWAIVTQQRHKELIFGLVLVEFLNPSELVEAFGATRAYLMLDEFARRLREMLRDSDITTRTTDDRLWLFLPFTPADGVANRLTRLVADVQPSGGPPLRARIRATNAPRDVHTGDTGNALMERLLNAPD